MAADTVVHEFAGGEVAVWIDNGVICIKTMEKHNDPVELAEEDARELGELLIRWVKEMR
jgi:hypothetical protein